MVKKQKPMGANTRAISVLPIVMMLASCADFVEVDTPKNEITGEAVYKDDATATAAVVGIYAKMSEASYFNNTGIPMLTGLSSDEFINASGYVSFEQNELLPIEATLIELLWQPGYRYIYYANAVLEGLENSSGVSTAVRRSLQGQAYFVRALCYFYLVNIFGNLPKVTGTGYEGNAFLPRMPVDSIYSLIENDLAQAADLLPRDFSTAYEDERTLPTTFAVHALRARMALYHQKWELAAQEADSVIRHDALFSLPPPEEAFNYNSPEAIWQIKPISLIEKVGTTEAQVFLGTLPVYIRPSLIEAFEVDDARRQWVGEMTDDGVEFFYIPLKYRYVIMDYLQPEYGLEYHIEFRLAEQYLIRAEARAHLDDLDGAIADLDAIRARAGLPALAEMGISWTRATVLERVMQERRIELFSEGHRWFDLIRTSQAEAVLGSIEEKLWNPTDVLFPVPQAEIDKNRNLEPQNDGY
jgi:starch-binding outer membrane protein, SusD/RagB family